MNQIEHIYSLLFACFGRQQWWPAQSIDEVIIGAVLTQNTNWNNVRRAIENLKSAQSCSLKSILSMDETYLKTLIKPAGFYNQKTHYLKNVSAFFGYYKYRWDELPDTGNLRNGLLNVKGIGKETADSILLYALKRPVFVVDAYTKRIMGRHISSFPRTYDAVQERFYNLLPDDVQLFNEYHALLVRCGKLFCRTKPLCSQCPLKSIGKHPVT